MFKDIKCIILDFDGTLVLTNHFKKTLYSSLFSNLEESHLEELSSKVNRLYGNATRKEILEKIINGFSEDNSLNLEKLLIKYKSKYINFASNCEQIPGSLETLEMLSKQVPLYICTSNPDEDITKIIVNRKWSSYFIKIYGSNMSKREVLSDIIYSNNFSPSQVLMVGDSDEDYQASERCGTNFAGIMNSESNFLVKPEHIFSSIFEMAESLNFG